MLFIVCTIIVIWFVFLAAKPEKDENANSNNVEQKQTYLTPEEIEKYEQEEFEKGKKKEIFNLLWELENLINIKRKNGKNYEELKKGYDDLFKYLSESDKKAYINYKNNRNNKTRNNSSYNNYANQNLYYEKYYEEIKEISKRQEYNDSDYYNSPYDIDFEDDPFRRTEKIYALHEEGQEELDDYYDEEYELNSGLYDDDDNYNEYNEYDNYDNDDNYDEYEEGQEDDLW